MLLLIVAHRVGKYPANHLHILSEDGMPPTIMQGRVEALPVSQIAPFTHYVSYLPSPSEIRRNLSVEHTNPCHSVAQGSVALSVADDAWQVAFYIAFSNSPF